MTSFGDASSFGSEGITKLPITVIQGNKTATGTIITPTTGTKIRVYGFMLNNANTTDNTIYLTFSTSSILFGKCLLAKNGGIVVFNLIPYFIEGAVDEVLTLNLASSGSVNFTIFYEMV